MKTLLPALAALALLANTASAATYDSPGRYPVTLVAYSALIPPDVLPPGTPTVGPTVYEGTLTIHRTHRGLKASFRGTSLDGLRVEAVAAFSRNWNGVTTSLLPVGGTMVEAITDIDYRSLIGGNLTGTVLVDGVPRHVHLMVGSRGNLLKLQVR